ncbi:MAG TPA: APC family permease [Fimbriimonadaceae bacterium]|nr:APC family permease [Fimbriimonadaceae bacterium]
MANLADLLFGRPLASREEGEQKIGVFAGVPLLGLDALASAAYGPEAALTILIPVGAAGLVYFGPILLVILAILTILYFSYRQTIAAYPQGGGSYTVARENLGTRAGLFAASALLVDYTLTVAVGISAGVGALVSAVPSLHPHILSICLGILVLIVLVNLRGVKESGAAFALPTYLFVGTLGATLIIGIVKTLLGGGHPVPVESPPALPRSVEAASLWLLMRSFASGCTAMTGVEAVSNGVGAFDRPTSRNAIATLTAIVLILGLLLAGIAFLCRVYGIGATDPQSTAYQSVISQLVAAVSGRGWFYYTTIGAVLAVLALSANTGFAGFPRLCRLLGKDEFLPRIFANRGRRLVYSHGIVILALLSGGLLVLFGGVTDRLIPLFAVGAFLAFSLSQAGMVVHWRKAGGRHAHASMLVNAIGAAATTLALIVVLAAKFTEGAWITILLIPGFVVLFYAVNRHYRHVAAETSCKRPIRTQDPAPVVVVPVKGWNTVTEKAVRFGMRLSPDVIAAHVGVTDQEIYGLKRDWERFVEAPLKEAGQKPPKLIAVSSPYRRLFTPLLNLIRDLEDQHPDRQIAVIIPELVETKWWQHFLHNQQAAGLKAALLFRGDRRIVVINVPWYLGEPHPAGAEVGDRDGTTAVP